MQRSAQELIREALAQIVARETEKETFWRDSRARGDEARKERMKPVIAAIDELRREVEGTPGLTILLVPDSYARICLETALTRTTLTVSYPRKLSVCTLHGLPEGMTEETDFWSEDFSGTMNKLLEYVGKHIAYMNVHGR